MTPNTTVTLFQTDFDISNKHVVYVTSEGDAFGAVSSFPSKTFTNCYWQRNGRAFRANGNINELQNYNYCVFENNGTRNYAFITSFEYHNDAYTDVYITLDWWLNYAGKYDFHMSPMIRQHPVSDFMGRNLYKEPYQPERIEPCASVEIAGTDIDNNVCLITQVSTQDEGRTVTFWEAIANTIQGNGAAIADYFSDVKSYPCDCIYEVQGNTSVVSITEAQQIAETFVHIGKPDYVIGAYKIPSWCRTIKSGKDVTSMTPYTETIYLPAPENEGEVKWNKILCSKQYNQISLFIYGEKNDLNIELFNPTELDSIQFAMFCNQSQNGCIAISPSNYGEIGGNKACTVFTSPPWDSVALLANVNQPWYQSSQQVTQLIAGMGASIGMAVGLAPIPAIATTAGLTTIRAMEGFNEKLSGSFGGNSGRISPVAGNVSAVRVIRYMPDLESIVQLNYCFSMYGYSYGGTPQLPNLHNMPFWNYVETLDAVITGREVPQWALDACIKRFNSGIFIYNNIGTYKKTDNCSSNIL